ncbi:hypothetical protein AB5J62_22685 [Amycolatopsis sp. cg5]|uniref:SecDF P1 head subdomain-containing protein n=1 Tax=Amycolatopsis sp. cg5 TaxID=3238802 RepID=UPI0035252D15
MRSLLLALLFALTACSTTEAKPPPIVAAGTPVELRVVVDAGGTTLKDKAGTEYQVGPVALVLARFTKIEAGAAETGGHHVQLEMPGDDAAKFAKFTEENVGKRIAMVVKGTVVMAPMVQSAITGGAIEISGGFTAADAGAIADTIRRG